MSVLNSPQLSSILEKLLPQLGSEADIHPLCDVDQLNKIKKYILSQKNAQDYLIKHYNEIPHQHEEAEKEVHCECKEREVITLKLSEVNLSEKTSVINVRRYLQRKIFEELKFDFGTGEALQQLGPLQVVGGLYLFQDKTNEELIAVQILYFRQDVKTYSFPLMHYQAKFAVHFSLKNDTQPILLDKLSFKKVQFLGQRKINLLNPFLVKKNASVLEGIPPYMLLFGSPAHKIATMTFRILPTEHWLLFYSKVNSRKQLTLSSSDSGTPVFIGQQQDMKIKLTLTKIETNSTEEVENVATLPFPFNCDIGCVGAKNDTSKDMYFGVTYEWEYRQRYMSHSTAFINLVNMLFQFQGLDSAEPWNEKEGMEHINNLLQFPLGFQKEDQPKDDKEPVPIEILSDEERNFWIQDDKIKYTFNSPEFQQWIEKGKLFIEEGENGIDFGCRVLAHINKNITYTALDEFRGCGDKGVASGVIHGQTDCGGKALLFCSVMRANKIPARLLHGQFADVGNITGSHLANITKEELAMGYHVMAEFFVNGVGWVPIETTGPVRMVGVDYQGFLYARDRSKAFLVKHYDYVYEIDYSKFLPKQKTANSKSKKFISWLKKLASSSKNIATPFYLSGFFGVRVEHHLEGLNLSISSSQDYNDNNKSISQQNACTTSLMPHEEAKDDKTEMNFFDFINSTEAPPDVRPDYNMYNYNGIDVNVPRLNWFQDVASVESINKFCTLNQS